MPHRAVVTNSHATLPHGGRAATEKVGSPARGRRTGGRPCGSCRTGRRPPRRARRISPSGAGCGLASAASS